MNTTNANDENFGKDVDRLQNSSNCSNSVSHYQIEYIPI